MTGTETDLTSFVQALIRDGWVETGGFTFKKGAWVIQFDTSSWMELGTETTPRLFDVPVPSRAEGGRAQWTLNLIRHLFETNEHVERARDRDRRET